MRHIKITALKTTLLCVSGLGMFTMNSPAFAGGCGLGVNPALCQTGLTVNQGTAPVFDNMTVNVHQPMGYLRSINYQRAPNTSITRVHGMMESAALSDFPSSFTNGCHPSSTAYCRQSAGTPVNVEFTAPPVMPAPVFRPAPVMAAPAAPRIVAVGGGYDPSKFIPRQYGEFTFTPGIAYLPTSYVNRNPADAARVLAENGYSTDNYPVGNMNLSAPVMSSNMTMPASVPSFAPAAGPNLLAGGPIGQAPQQGVPGATYLGSVVTGQTTTGSAAPSGNVIGGVDGSGGYWEKVSGLTMFGDTVATSVVCRRQAPQTTAQVVSPVYGVPQPVPTPRPYFVDVPYKVKGNFMPKGCRPAGAPYIAPPLPRPHFAPAPAAIPGVLPYGPSMAGPRFGPQFGGGFRGVAGVAPTVGQITGRPSHNMHSGWTY